MDQVSIKFLKINWRMQLCYLMAQTLILIGDRFHTSGVKKLMTMTMTMVIVMMRETRRTAQRRQTGGWHLGTIGSAPSDLTKKLRFEKLEDFSNAAARRDWNWSISSTTLSTNYDYETLSSPSEDDFPIIIKIFGLFVLTRTKETLRKLFPPEKFELVSTQAAALVVLLLCLP